MIDMRLFYPSGSDPHLVEYVNEFFFSFDPHKVQSQTWYQLMCDNIVLLRRFVKKAIYATSSNYFEILTIHQASCECTWPRSVNNTY